MLAEIMPESELVEQMLTEINEYKEALLLNKDTKEAGHKLAVTCMMFIQKQANVSVTDTLSEIDKIERIENMFNPSKG